MKKKGEIMKYLALMFAGLFAGSLMAQSLEVADSFDCVGESVELKIELERKGLQQVITKFELIMDGAVIPVTRTEIQHTAVGTIYSAMESRVVNVTKTHAIIVPGAFVEAGDSSGLDSLAHYLESTARRLNLPNKPFLTASNQSSKLACRLTKK